MMNLTSLAQSGLASAALGGLALHISVGVFFTCSGWNKLTNPGRHATFVKTLAEDHVPALAFNAWWVPAWELVGGLALALGLVPAFSAAVLLIIILVACFAEGKTRVALYSPINQVDCLADWLYLPEVLYGIILGAIVLGV